jgi:hypothetical protein
MAQQHWHHLGSFSHACKGTENNAGSMLKAAVHLLAGRSTAAETTKKIMEDFDKLMNSGDPQQATELLKPEVRPSDFTPISCTCPQTHLLVAFVSFSAASIALHQLASVSYPLHFQYHSHSHSHTHSEYYT